MSRCLLDIAFSYTGMSPGTGGSSRQRLLLSLTGQELPLQPGTHSTGLAMGRGAVLGKGRALSILKWWRVCWRRRGQRERRGDARPNMEIAPEEANEPQLTEKLPWLIFQPPALSLIGSLFYSLRILSIKQAFPYFQVLCL